MSCPPPNPSSTAGPFDGPAPGNAENPVLLTRGVKRSFPIGGRTLDVLHGVDLELCVGERLGLVGASGAGKSTFLHHIGLLDRPSAGTVQIEGQDVWSLGPHQRALVRNQKIGFVFQQFHLLPELSALENVMLPGMISLSIFGKRKQKRQLKTKATLLLESFGLKQRLGHRPAQLSGGEKQRVAIARALILDPPILIADEPTGNLDSETSAKILDLILAEQKKRTLSLLLVTHDEEVARRCDRIVHMRDGRIVSEPEGESVLPSEPV